MTKVAKHFKVHCSIQNHEKTAVMAADNDLFALYVRLGMLAIERFADRTDNTFIVSDRELPRLTGKYRADVARTLLRRLADVSPTSAERDGDVWRITIPNLSKKQGFCHFNGADSSASSSSSSSSTTTPTKRNRTAPEPPAPPLAKAPELVLEGAPAAKAPRARRASPKSPVPEELSTDERARIRSWAAANGIPTEKLGAAWERFRSWWEGDGGMKANWEATFRVALTDGWPLKPPGAGAHTGDESREQAKVRRTQEAGRRAFEKLERDPFRVAAIAAGGA